MSNDIEALIDEFQSVVRSAVIHGDKEAYVEEVEATKDALITALRQQQGKGEPVANGVTLTGRQIKNALEFVNPDGDRDLDQLECELTIRYFPASTDQEMGEKMPAGYWAFFTDYPDEGRIDLDVDAIQSTSPPAARELSDEEIIHNWNNDEHDKQYPGTMMLNRIRRVLAAAKEVK